MLDNSFLDGSADPVTIRLEMLVIGPLVTFLAMALVIARGFHPSHPYLGLGITAGLVFGVFIAWKVQARYVGRWYTPRRGDPGPMSGSTAWMRGLLAGAFTSGTLFFALGWGGNHVLGAVVQRQYEVTGQYVQHGKGGTCYGLDLADRASPFDHLSMCVGRSEQMRYGTGLILDAHERASWFGEQVLSLHREVAGP